MDVANLGHEDGIPESLPQCGVWLFFSFLPKNVQNMSKTHPRRDFSRLFGVDVLWRHRRITSGMGLSHPPGWDNISPDIKIRGYSCLKSGKRESHPSVHDLQSTTRLAESWMLQIIDTRMGFPCPFHNVVIDYFSPTPFILINNPISTSWPWHRSLQQRHAIGNVVTS